jgi:hypothetical protein
VRWVNGLGQPAVCYFHPWEFDSGIPRYPLAPALRLLSYANLHTTEGKLRRLLREFEFAPLGEVIRAQSAAMPSLPVEALSRTVRRETAATGGTGAALSAERDSAMGMRVT